MVIYVSIVNMLNYNKFIVLQNKWSPMYDISAILTSIRSLLSDPNPSSPANQQAAQMFVNNL